MTRPDHTEQRLTNLEIKASYTDDLLDTLNDIVARQQDLIDRLRREVHALREQLHGGTPTAPRSLADDLPPHY
jgi:SlyX protein